MRHKLIKLFQQIESLSGAILKYEPAPTSASPNAHSSHDQLKLQRNIRFYAINYLKDHSFTLSSLPTPDEYAKLKAQRQVYLVEEMRRTELEHLKHQKKINERAAKLRPSEASNNGHANITSSKNGGSTQSNVKISVDHSNGWIPTVNKQELYLDDDDDKESNEEDSPDGAKSDLDDGSQSLNSKKSGTATSEEDKALRVQIQLVEGYLKDAKKHKKYDEVRLLEQNLNELLNNLVNK